MQINTDDIIDHLEGGMRAAFNETLKKYLSEEYLLEVNFDSNAAFGTFKKMLSAKFDEWENLPDSIVRP